MIVEVIRILVRRWYLVLLGVLLTLGMAFGTRTSSPPTYEAHGLVLILPSKSAVAKGGNPLLVLDGLQQPAGILVAHYASVPAGQEVADISPTAKFTVLLDDATRGPVIAVDVVDNSPASAMAVLNHLIADIPKQLVTLQQQVQAVPNTFIRSMPLTVDTAATQNRSATIRLMIVVYLLGLVGTIFATVGLDSYLNNRRRSRRAAESPSDSHRAEQSPDKSSTAPVATHPSARPGVTATSTNDVADDQEQTTHPRRTSRRKGAGSRSYESDNQGPTQPESRHDIEGEHVGVSRL